MKALAAVLVAAVLASAKLSAPPDPGTLTFVIYKDARDEFRWRLKASNGRIIGMADEGYSTKHGCKEAVELIKQDAAKAAVEETSTE
jgi:uncharacterized protein